MKKTVITFAILAALQVASQAAAIGFFIDSGGKSLRDENNVALNGGAAAVAADGTQVVLGYFADASTAAPFGTAGPDAFGTFIALTGPGTPAWGAGNTVNNFTIGDAPSNGAGNGEIFSNLITINTGVADQLLPQPGTPLILRFFNSSKQRILDLANAGGLWNWKLPSVPTASVNINLDDPGLVSRGLGSNNRNVSPVLPTTTNVQTLNPVPEPSSALLALAGAAMFAARRRKR